MYKEKLCMADKLKQPQIVVGLAIILVVIITLFFGRNTDNKAGVKVDSSGGIPIESTIEVSSMSHADHSKEVEAEAESEQGTPRHQDMLTDDMKQAIRDQLILHGPGTTYKKSDGTIVLPSTGRSTQVSVAVQMPDGSIQIREYSELPKDNKPVYTVSPQAVK
jgi:hypothetical protein